MKAIRLHIKQNSANYRREEAVRCRMTYPLPPYSTVIGALHKACGYTSYHPMKLSIQGKYGSMERRVFKEDFFLNSLQNDRGILVKMVNPNMLSSAYQKVAEAQKSQGNDFDKGITINVINQKLLDEYRNLNRLKKRIDGHKKVVAEYKNRLKNLKNNPNASKEDIKRLAARVKRFENIHKRFEEEKYTIPKSCFRTLTKGPKYYELLCDVELVIHVASDEQTMQDIFDNIGNLTAIGRGEDFVEVLECTFAELEKPKYGVINDTYSAYVPVKIIEKSAEVLDVKFVNEGVRMGGTKYLLNKDYCVESAKGSLGKRIFNKVAVIYTSKCNLLGADEDVFLDTNNDNTYIVCMA